MKPVDIRLLTATEDQEARLVQIALDKIQEVTTNLMTEDEFCEASTEIIIQQTYMAMLLRLHEVQEGVQLLIQYWLVLNEKTKEQTYSQNVELITWYNNFIKKAMVQLSASIVSDDELRFIFKK